MVVLQPVLMGMTQPYKLVAERKAAWVPAGTICPSNSRFERLRDQTVQEEKFAAGENSKLRGEPQQVTLNLEIEGALRTKFLRFFRLTPIFRKSAAILELTGTPNAIFRKKAKQIQN